MKQSPLFIASDHAGFAMKQALVAYLIKQGYTPIDLGASMPNPKDDYPDYAFLLAQKVVAQKGSKGILLCGSGQGVCIAANRKKGVRAALCWDVASVKASRNDDDANVLCLAARLTPLAKTKAIVDAWLTTPFAKEPRFKRRIQKLD